MLLPNGRGADASRRANYPPHDSCCFPQVMMSFDESGRQGITYPNCYIQAVLASINSIPRDVCPILQHVRSDASLRSVGLIAM